MADVTSMHTTTTDAVYIPEIWSPLVIEFRDKNLVMANLVTRRDIDVSQYGDKIHFPVTSAGDARTYVQGERLTENLQVDTDTEVTITVDQFKHYAFHIPWIVKKQNKYDIMAMEMRKAGEAVARVIDSALHAEALSEFTGTAQNSPSTAQVDDLTVDDIVGAQVALDNSDVPASDRYWVFHPSAHGELLTMTGNYFISIDFQGEKPMATGQIGTMLGSPVYKSTNVGTTTAGSPAETAYANLYFHKDALGLAMQVAPQVEMEYDLDSQGHLGNVRTAYGVGILRADHGLVVYTVAD